MTTTFYLTPDKFSAHHIRRELMSNAPTLGIQVGTWPELLELARTSYCLPEPDDNWQEKVQAGIHQVGHAFWHKSLATDPEVTAIIISQALSDLLWGIGPQEKIPSTIKKQLSKRGGKQITDLLALHKKMAGVLPVELTLIHELLAVDQKQAIRSITVHYDSAITNLNPWQTALVNRLNKDAKHQNVAQDNVSPFTKAIAWQPPAKSTNGLRHLQHNLFSPTCTKQKTRSGLQWLTCRDYRQEVEVAVGMVQNLMTDTGCPACEIGLLLPETSAYCQTVAELFNMAGLPLAGLTTITHSPDLGRELLYFFLLSRQGTPPPMLLASLFGSPLLPWGNQSVEICQAIMDGKKISSIVADLPENQQRTAWFLASTTSQNPTRLAKSLRGLVALLSKGEDHTEHRQTGLALCQEILATIDKDLDEIDWQSLLQICRPQLMSHSETGDINLEGIRVIHPHHEPWQQIQHLLVLGFNEGSYPASPGLYPVIPEEDRLRLDTAGICLPTQRKLRQEYRQRFHRQLCSATKSITFFIPQMDSTGNRLQPSSSLGFMAQLFDDVKSSEDLLLDLTQAANWSKIKHLALAPEQSPTPPRPFATKPLKLQDNLLTKRKDSDGNTAPESPSGLETMLVSPLAWLFKRYHIDSHEWAAEGLDVLIMGSIAHDIFEKLFTHNKPLPGRGRIKTKVKSLFNQVIKEDYPFLARSEYQVECQQMIREYGEAAEGWWDFLTKNKLEILGEETWLTGRFNHHPIRGKADLICRAPNKSLLVVDYKTAKSTNRAKIMEHGFDHQTSLYCQMLERGELPDKIPVKLKNHLKKDPETGALYYTLRDQTVLGNKQTNFLNDATIIEQEISINGLARIRKQMKDLRNGTVKLNYDNAEDWFKKETGITPYALDNSPLIGLFRREAK